MNCAILAVTKRVHIILLLIALFTAGNINAQAPVINSFNPASGPIGTIVTINGTGFDTNPTSNVVYFGAQTANVITANATQLTVAVPVGANYHPISVTAKGLTAYSQAPFVVTFPVLPFTSGSFNNKVDIPSGNPSGIAIKDLDNDGKPDMVSVSDNSVNLFKNNCQPGVVSFPGAGTKYMSGYSVGVAVDDLDGDGKPDIVVANFGSNTISVFKNTSVTNQIYFDNAITFATSINPYNVAIADFNGDGKPDIVATNEYSSPAVISVFINSTVAGGPISFLPKVDFPAPSSCRGVSVGDMDMDGKTDIIVASQSGVVSVFKNTSSINTVSFAAKTDYVMTAFSSTESVVICDLDGDGKPDMAAADNNSPGNISVLKNNSTPGNLAFSARQDFATGLNTYSISAGDINGDGKPDIAVCNQLDNTVSVLINTSTTGNINFAGKVNFATGDFPRSTNIVDVDGSGKPDLIVGDNNASFISVLLAPVQKQTAVINFPAPVTPNIDQNNILYPGATSNNTLTPITYTSSNPSVAYIGTDGLVHVIAAGTTIITASQSGNMYFDAATPVSQTFNITQSQSIQFPAITAKITCDADFSAAAVSSNSTIPLTYASSNPAVATISSGGIIHIIAAGTTTITISQSGNTSYSAAIPQSQILTVTTPGAPVVAITADHASICTGNPVIFTATVTNAGTNITYQWQVNGVNKGTNSSVFTTVLNNTTDAVQCLVTNNAACQVVGTSNVSTGIIINTFVTPSVSITSSAMPVCNGASITFSATPTNGGTNPIYQWMINGINAGINSATFTATTFNNGDLVTCTLTSNSTVCLTSATAVSNTVTVSITPTPNPPPSVTINASATKAYQGTSITLTATAINAGTVTNYQWQVNGANAGTNSPTYTSANFNNNDEATCIITSSIACSTPATSATLTITIVPIPGIMIPNTFTPNGDSINDEWDITGLANYPDCAVTVYNRNGMVVFQSKGYALAWNGVYNGKALPISTYYYMIRLTPQSYPLSGFVIIAR